MKINLLQAGENHVTFHILQISDYKELNFNNIKQNVQKFQLIVTIMN